MKFFIFALLLALLSPPAQTPIESAGKVEMAKMDYFWYSAKHQAHLLRERGATRYAYVNGNLYTCKCSEAYINREYRHTYPDVKLVGAYQEGTYTQTLIK